MTTQVEYRSHFFEGGNVATIFCVPAAVIGVVVFYSKVGAFVRPYEISVSDTYSYVFNLFAIEFGALLSLFGLFACRPTPFLERMKNTMAFRAIVSNTNITLVLSTISIALTFVFGLIKVQPEATLTGNSLFYIFWCGMCFATCCIYARTVRLIMTALT